MLGYATRIYGDDLIGFIMEMKKQPGIEELVEQLIFAYDEGEDIDPFINKLRELV